MLSKSRLLGSLISINGEKITSGDALNLEYCRIPDHGKINKKNKCLDTDGKKNNRIINSNKFSYS